MASLSDINVADRAFGKYVWVLYVAIGLGALWLVYWITTGLLGKNAENVGKTVGNIGKGAVEATATTTGAVVDAGKSVVDYFDEAVGLSNWLTSPTSTMNKTTAYSAARSAYAKQYGISIDQAVEYGFPTDKAWFSANGY